MASWPRVVECRRRLNQPITVYDGVHHAPWVDLSMVDISTAVGMVPPVPKKKGLRWKNLAESKLSEHIYQVYIVRYWHYWHPLWLSSNGASKTAPQWGVIFTVVHGTTRCLSKPQHFVPAESTY